MANPVGFEGANQILKATDRQREQGVRDVEIFHSEELGIVQCWRFTDDELKEINETGVVWIALLGPPPPIIISGEALVHVNDRPAKAEPYIEPSLGS